MTMPYLKIEQTGDVCTITLSRPDVRNAFNAELISQLTSALGSARQDESLRVLILAAEGPIFCAGADFHWMASKAKASSNENINDARHLFDMFHSLYSFPCPTIARIQGNAFGGGAGLIACCDFAVMDEKAVLSFSEVRIGLIPATISPFVLRKIGINRARDLFLTGAPISAARTAEIGIVNRVVSGDTLDSAVHELADQLLQGGPEALRMTKKLLNDISYLSLNDARDLTAERIAEQRISTEAQEGMAAFLEKRKPIWNRSRK